MFGSQWYIKVGNLGFNLLFLNILWSLFSVLGLFVLGLFPATVALYAVLRKAIVEPDDIPVFKVYWREFKKEFVRSNILGYLFVVVGLILYLDFKLLQQFDIYMLHFIFMGIIIFCILIYLVTLLFVFPVFVHLDLKLWEYPKYALILAIGRPLMTITMIVGLTIVFILYIKFPVLIPIFGVSILSYLVMKIALHSLPKKDITHS